MPVKDYQVNLKIKYPRLRVILGTGENVEVMDTFAALKKAEELGLDLIVVTENADPPVAKITDFSKFLYTEKKKASEARSRSKQSELKELRLSPTISSSDIQQRVNRACEFLSEGNLVKVSLIMRGRQAMFPQIGEGKMRDFMAKMAPFAKTESELKRVGNTLSVIFVKK